jgi:hypothetical protein
MGELQECILRPTALKESLLLLLARKLVVYDIATFICRVYIAIIVEEDRMCASRRMVNDLQIIRLLANQNSAGNSHPTSLPSWHRLCSTPGKLETSHFLRRTAAVEQTNRDHTLRSNHQQMSTLFSNVTLKPIRNMQRTDPGLRVGHGIYRSPG